MRVVEKESDMSKLAHSNAETMDFLDAERALENFDTDLVWLPHLDGSKTPKGSAAWRLARRLILWSAKQKAPTQSTGK